MEEELIRDCYGEILAPGDEVITHVQWDSDSSDGIGISKCVISHLSTSGSGRLILQQNKNGYVGLQRWPKQVAKI